MSRVWRELCTLDNASAILRTSSTHAQPRQGRRHRVHTCRQAASVRKTLPAVLILSATISCQEVHPHLLPPHAPAVDLGNAGQKPEAERRGAGVAAGCTGERGKVEFSCGKAESRTQPLLAHRQKRAKSLTQISPRLRRAATAQGFQYKVEVRPEWLQRLIQSERGPQRCTTIDKRKLPRFSYERASRLWVAPHFSRISRDERFERLTKPGIDNVQTKEKGSQLTVVHGCFTQLAMPKLYLKWRNILLGAKDYRKQIWVLEEHCIPRNPA